MVMMTRTIRVKKCHVWFIWKFKGFIVHEEENENLLLNESIRKQAYKSSLYRHEAVSFELTNYASSASGKSM